MPSIVVRLIVNAFALFVATLLVPGITLSASSTAGKVGTLLGVAAIFGLVNAVVKPIVKVIGCGFYILTLGLIALVVNALLFLLAGFLASELGLKFAVDGFWPGFFGALIVSIVSFVLSLVIPDKYDRR